MRTFHTKHTSIFHVHPTSQPASQAVPPPPPQTHTWMAHLTQKRMLEDVLA